jgi:ribosomal protein L5
MYNTEIRESMKKKFGYKNVMEIPKLEKIVVNMGVGEAKDNAKLLEILKDSNYVMQECIEDNNKLIRILEICCNV